MPFTFGLTRSICVRWASITSVADHSFAWIQRAISVAVRKQISVSGMKSSSFYVASATTVARSSSQAKPISSNRLNSSGQWLRPFLLGTKIMPAGVKSAKIAVS